MSFFGPISSPVLNEASTPIIRRALHRARIVAVLVGLAVQLSNGVLSVVPRLQSAIGKIQTIDLIGAAARLLAIVALMYLFLNGAVAIAIGSATLLVQYWMLRHYVAGVIDLHAPENEEDRAAM